jgi:hypothetical protein
MKANNAKFLDENRGIYTTLVNAGFIQNLTNETRQELLRITREEFSPGYLCCMHCSADVAAMVKYVFHQYDVWKASNPTPIEKPKRANAKAHKNLS